MPRGNNWPTWELSYLARYLQAAPPLLAYSAARFNFITSVISNRHSPTMAINPVANLGSQGLRTARLGLGCMSLSKNIYVNNVPTEEEAIRLVQSAYNQGVRHFNTSLMYGPYDNEILLGKALEDKPDAVISTKWGMRVVPGKGLVSDFTPENCRQSCLDALERLRRPAIDLYIMRGPITPDVDFDATCQAMKALVNEGKVKCVGLSEVSADHIRRAHSIVPISAMELQWNLFTRDAEKDIVPVCRELGIGIIAYSPLGSGMLSGTIRSLEQLDQADFRRKVLPRFSALDKNLMLVAEVERIATAKGATAAQVALAWVMSRGDDVFPIPGTKRIEQLTENMGALNVKLTEEDLVQLERLADKVEGDRFFDMARTYHGSAQFSEL